MTPRLLSSCLAAAAKHVRPARRAMPAPFATPAESPSIIRITTPDGATLHVQSYGPRQGTPIVLIHGWSCAIEYWNPQINALAEQYRVIAYDQRGHGRSDMGGRHLDATTLADDLSAVLAATVTDGDRAILVGHSMGGITVMAWAQHHPDEVHHYARAVVLANTAADLIGIDYQHDSGWWMPIRNLAFDLILTTPIALPLPPRAITRQAFGWLAMTPDAPGNAVAFMQRIVYRCDARTRHKWVRAVRAMNVTDGLANLTVPACVIGSTRDMMTPAAASAGIAEVLRSNGSPTEYIEFSDAGHASNLQEVAAFNNAIVQIAQASSGAARIVQPAPALPHFSNAPTLPTIRS